ncbi:MAG: hypothetical protein IPM13_14275 [Phycisphaerales bacterium]|nr:hypothetical protein [Phycisphaerales bacterium]
MRHGLSALLICLLAATTALAQANPERPGRESGRRGAAAGPRDQRPGREARGDRERAPRGEREAVRELRAALRLTAEQQPAFDAAARAYLDGLEEMRLNGQRAPDLMDDFRDAARNRDEAKLAELRPKMEEMRRQREELRATFIETIRPTLSDAQNEALDRFARGGPRGGRFGPDGRGWERMLETLPERLEMTPEQVTKFDAVVAEHRETLAAHREEIQPLVQEMRAARQAGDDERAAELREQIEQARAGVGGPGALRTRLSEFLTPEQMTRLDDLWPQLDGAPRQLDARRMFDAARRLDLTRDQSEKLRALERQARTQRGEGPDRRALQAERAAKLRADILAILTEPQKAEFEKLMQRAERAPRRGGPGGPGGPGRPGGPDDGAFPPPPPPPPPPLDDDEDEI